MFSSCTSSFCSAALRLLCSANLLIDLVLERLIEQVYTWGTDVQTNKIKENYGGVLSYFIPLFFFLLCIIMHLKDQKILTLLTLGILVQGLTGPVLNVAI